MQGTTLMKLMLMFFFAVVVVGGDDVDWEGCQACARKHGLAA